MISRFPSFCNAKPLLNNDYQQLKHYLIVIIHIPTQTLKG
nr:MAG TPA: hypothetical protein [Caudoviricetes sp.]